MAIAGIGPEVEVFAHKAAFIDALIPNVDYYTTESVREILIKFAHVIVNGDEGYDIPDETIVRGVDEFMESDGGIDD